MSVNKSKQSEISQKNRNETKELKKLKKLHEGYFSNYAHGAVIFRQNLLKHHTFERQKVLQKRLILSLVKFGINLIKNE
jgi:hypothetical protein